MFLNISPSSYNAEESKNSLFMGTTVKEIKNDPQKNFETKESEKIK